MKRIISMVLTLFLVLNFVGCSQGNDTKFSKNNSAKIKYTDDQILFVARDFDKEKSQDIVYSYNYKGELLHSRDDDSAIGYYSENGLAPATDKTTGKVGFVDKDGVFVIDPIYTYAAPFSDDGIALVAKLVDWERKYGYINSKGEEVIPFIYDNATSLYDFGYALVGIKDNDEEDDDFYSYIGYDYIINKKGKIVYTIEDEFDIVWLTKDYLIGYKDEQDVILNYSGKELFKTEEDEFLSVKNGTVVKNTYKDSNGMSYIVNSEIFDGKKFIAPKKDYEITSKCGETTISGVAFGVTKNGETVIPFEYDSITEYGEYFVAVKYNDNYDSYDQIYGIYYDQVFDIYDKNFNKTAENIEYAFYDRHSEYGQSCQLPNGYFQITRKCDSERLYGIVDYTGKIIVEPVFYRGIKLWTYEGMGRF